MTDPTDPADLKVTTSERPTATDTPDPTHRRQRQAEVKRQAGAKANRQAQGQRPNRPVPKVVEVAPIATPASMRSRHWGLLVSMFLLVVVPVSVTGWYLWTRAVDQYASVVGFTVREEGGSSATDFLGGFAAQIAGGGSTQSDTDILFEFIQSHDLVARVDAAIDLRGHYGAPYDQDPVFALKSDSSFEELVDYWSRTVRISYDQSVRLMKLEILAFSPEMAQSIGQLIITESEKMINALNATARSDILYNTERDLEEAESRLKSAREALVIFRTRTQTVDPVSDLQARMGVVSTLQQQLAEALISLDMLGANISETDPRVAQATRRIEVIRHRIKLEREAVTDGGPNSAGGMDYPSLLAEYERLIVDREFAEETYRAALTALDVARANAQRQSSYLTAFVRPTLPQTAEYPRRATLFAMTVFFLVFAWAIMALIFYSVRDSR